MGLHPVGKIATAIIVSGGFVGAVYSLGRFYKDFVEWFTSLQWNMDFIIKVSLLLLGPALLLIFVLFLTYSVRHSKRLQVVTFVVITLTLLDFTVLISTIYTKRENLKGEISRQLIVAFFHETMDSKPSRPKTYAAAKLAFDDFFEDTDPKKPMLQYVPMNLQSKTLNNVLPEGILQTRAIIASTKNPSGLNKKVQEWYRGPNPIFISIIPALDRHFNGEPGFGSCATSLDDQFLMLLYDVSTQGIAPLLIVYSDDEHGKQNAVKCQDLARKKGLEVMLWALSDNDGYNQKAQVCELVKRYPGIVLLVSRLEAVSFCHMLTSQGEQYRGVLLLPSLVLCEEIKLIRQKCNLNMIAAVPLHFYSEEVRILERRFGHEMTPLETTAYLAASLVAYAINNVGDQPDLLREAVFSRHSGHKGLRNLGIDSLNFSRTNQAILPVSIVKF